VQLPEISHATFLISFRRRGWSERIASLFLCLLVSSRSHPHGWTQPKSLSGRALTRNMSWGLETENFRPCRRTSKLGPNRHVKKNAETWKYNYGYIRNVHKQLKCRHTYLGKSIHVNAPRAVKYEVTTRHLPILLRLWNCCGVLPGWTVRARRMKGCGWPSWPDRTANATKSRSWSSCAAEKRHCRRQTRIEQISSSWLHRCLQLPLLLLLLFRTIMETTAKQQMHRQQDATVEALC